MGRAWQGVVNENRVLAFKLGGTATLPARRTITQAADIPNAMLVLAEDTTRVARGKKLYAQYCYMCHGLDAMSGGVITDLRYATAQTFEKWATIVIGGSRADRGMRSFAGAITPDDALAIRAYVLNRAAQMRSIPRRN